jgi:outer membrane protein
MRSLERLFSIGLFFCVIILAAGTSSAEEQRLNLDEIVKLAQQHNPQIEIARQQCLQSSGIHTQAISGYLPHLGVGGSVARQHIDNLEPDDTENVTLASVNASQLIYDFGNTGGAIESSRMSLKAFDDNLYRVRQDIVLVSKRAFYDVLAKKRLIEVEAQAVKDYEQQLYRAEKYFDAGVRTKIDVTNAGVKLSESKLALLQARSNYKTARVRLEQVLGIQPNYGNYTLLSSEGELDLLAAGKPAMPDTLEDLLPKAFENRTDMQAVKSLVLAAEADIRRAKSGYFPSISANAGYDEYDTDMETFEDQWRVGIDLTWELFSGFETEGEMVEARGRLREVQAALANLQLAITREVTDSYLRADENREGVDIADETLGLARENLDMAEKRYIAGLNDIIEYNEAQLNFIRSQTSLVTTYYDYLTALAMIDNSTGVTSELETRNREEQETGDEEERQFCQVPE